MRQCEDCGVSFNDLDEEFTHVDFCPGPSIERHVEKAVREEREAVVQYIHNTMRNIRGIAEDIKRGEHRKP